jgi:predicted transcriptional regulator of viral defense system
MSQGEKTSQSRERLGKLLREGGEVLTVDDAARILGRDNVEAAKTLARWCNQGWLSRIKRGVYVPVPVDAINTDRAIEDAWVLVPELFGNAYIGGWSAAEHWDLTEQIFRDICVFSARPVPKRRSVIHNIPFVVTHAPPETHFGTKTMWKKETKLLISDPTKPSLICFQIRGPAAASSTSRTALKNSSKVLISMPIGWSNMRQNSATELYSSVWAF